MARTRTAKVTPPADVDTDDVFEDLDEVEAAPVVEPAPKRGRRSAPKANATPTPAEKTGSGFDSTWLAEHVSETVGRAVDSRTIRMALRKLAADGVLAREVGTDRARYDFPKGANDPTVKAVVKIVKDGPVRAPKADTAEDAPTPAKRARKAAPAVEAVEDEAPAKPTRRRAPAKATAPAKAAPAATTRRRRAAAPAE